MVLFWITLFLALIGSNADGELRILYSPDSLKFNEVNLTEESILKEIYSASLGLPVEEFVDWNGLLILDMNHLPEAVVEVRIEGISGIGERGPLQSKVFPLVTDKYERNMAKIISLRIRKRFRSSKNHLVIDFNLTDTGPFGTTNSTSDDNINDFKLTYLNPKKPLDRVVLTELSSLRAVIEKVLHGIFIPDQQADFFSFHFLSLTALSKFYGISSPETTEALDLLGNALQDLTKAFVKAYDGSVLVTAVTTDAIRSNRRIIRQVADVMQEEAPKNTRQIENDKLLELRNYYSAMHIIFWITVMFVFTMLAVTYAVMDLDPGKDTVLYRMVAAKTGKKNV